LTGYHPGDFEVDPVTMDDMRNVVLSLKSKPCNLYVCPVGVYKYLIDIIISHVFSILVNRSFSSGLPWDD